jgi:3-amino-5-hydroxybenzoate synthase
MTLALYGGTPVRCRPFPDWPHHDDTERTAVLRALDQGQWWRVGGAEVTAFEREFADFHGAPAALAVCNGTQALELSLELLGIGPGDEVIVPAIPVPVDVDPDTYCMNPALLTRTPRTRAVIPVHMAGHTADMDAIGAWASTHGVAVIQDAAHAHGGIWRGRRVGELGSIACFSFQNGKLMTAGEGGAVLLPDEALYEEAFIRHSCGRPIGDRYYAHKTPSSNFRMNEFTGAVLRAQLTRLPEQNVRRESRWKELSHALADIPGVRPQGTDPRCELNPHYMAMFTLEDTDVSRNLVVDALIAEGIPAFVNYPPIYRTEAFWAGPHAGLPPMAELAERCPASERLGRDGIWLHHRVLLGTAEDAADVAAAVAKVLDGIPGIAR